MKGVASERAILAVSGFLMALVVTAVAVNSIMGIFGNMQSSSDDSTLEEIESNVQYKCQDGQTDNPTTNTFVMEDAKLNTVEQLTVEAVSGGRQIVADLEGGESWKSDKFDLSKCIVNLDGGPLSSGTYDIEIGFANDPPQDPPEVVISGN